MRYVIDENGNSYSSLWSATKAYGICCGGSALKRLNKTGFCTLGGHRFQLFVDNQQVKKEIETKIVLQKDPMVERLKKRYSDSEIEAIARGEGIERRRVDFPEIRLYGAHHKFIVISDTHIGSV